MNAQEIKRILAAHRPGTSDGTDPQVAEALKEVERDPGLKAWFERQSGFQRSMRESFRQIPVPPDLPARLMSVPRVVPLPAWWERPVVWAAAAGIILLISLSVFRVTRPAGDTFAIFETRMVQAALRQYRMDIVTNDMAQIRRFLARSRAPDDYELRGRLAQLAPVGAGSLSWQDRRVSMVCLDSSGPNATNILYLFVVEQSAVTRPPLSVPEFRKVNKLATASWTKGNKTYLLAAPFDVEQLRRYF